MSHIETFTRPNWDQYGMSMAYAASLRSQDPFVKVGAAAFREDHSIAATGYNGAPPNVEISWNDRDERRKYVCHAELNCLRYIKPGEAKTLYVTLSPCSECIKTIGAFGINRIVYSKIYDRDTLTFDIARVYGISMEQLTFNAHNYYKQYDNNYQQ
jgi:dCMP deaminase